MAIRKKFVIWLSIWLSLGSFVSACGTDEKEGTTLEAAGSSLPTPDPTSGLSDSLRTIEDEQLRKYVEEVRAKERREAAEAARLAEEQRKTKLRADRARRQQQALQAQQTAPAAVTQTPSSGICGGDLPPCWVLRRENRNHDPRLWNGGCYAPVGHTGKSPCGTSSASGIYQIVRGTWGSKLVDGQWRLGYGGYMNAADAPLSVQLEHARKLWNNGKGCSHWGAC